MPLYSEFRQHQGSTGYAYPNRVVQSVERQVLTDVEYDIVRLENDYIRILILPALGGRILEGYDKKNDYHFLYRHSRIKPVLVGNYGSWISGGMEWNYPFHHRPSTFRPVDYRLEQREDGTAIVWLSEASISPGQYRIKGTVGVTLRPETSFFETKVILSNRTERECPFMWWENAGVHVNADYQLFFPQDVNWVHHHYDRHHATFPIHKGWYAVEHHAEPHDISVHKNTIKGNSFFAGPSQYDFFGGYDHRKQAGIIHVANRHLSPGKKMFQWALEDLGDAWNANLTDFDGEHAELMAGSFADDQPDFSWLAPYETKKFSQYWYPFQKIGIPVFATLDGAIAIDRERSKVRLVATSSRIGSRLVVKCGTQEVLNTPVSLRPAESIEFEAALSNERFHISWLAADGTTLFDYSEVTPEIIRLPKDNPGLTKPHDKMTAQEITIAGRHVEQYRDPLWRKEEFYSVALERDPDYIPALVGMAGVRYESGLYDQALSFLNRAQRVQNACNSNPSDGTISYWKGLCLLASKRFDEAYDVLYKASWSHNVISYAMNAVAGIDGRRSDYKRMKEHATAAIHREFEHPVAHSYLAIALWKLGDSADALEVLNQKLKRDPLDHLAAYLKTLIEDKPLALFLEQLNSNPSQTVLDITFDLVSAGLDAEAERLLTALASNGRASSMALYALAWIEDRLGRPQLSMQFRNSAAVITPVDTFPYRQIEIEILESALAQNASDAHAANLLGCILYDKRRWHEAAAEWKKAIEAAPDYYMPYRNLALVQYSYLDRRPDALPLLTKAMELHPKDDFLLKEVNYVMARLGVDPKKRLAYVLENLPSKPSDHLTWDLADAYSSTLDFDKALETLACHDFVAAECCETYLTEAFTFACSAKGRLALSQGRLEEALDWFRRGQRLPASFRAGWWDTQALYYIRYFEALTLLKLKRTEEAKPLLEGIVTFVRSEYSPHMGPEVDYYIACAYRLLGDDITARKHISLKVMEWEGDFASDVDRKPPASGLYISYIDDWDKTYKATMQTALGYSRLFFDDLAGARSRFKESLVLAPDNVKVIFELSQLDVLDGTSVSDSSVEAVF